jgi:hypothetical protein
VKKYIVLAPQSVRSTDIQVGDTFSSNQGLGYNEKVTGKVSKIDGDDIYMEGQRMPFSKESLIHVEGWSKEVGKLCLCSFDYKVGDILKSKHAWNEVVTEILDKGYVKTDLSNREHTNNLFKVIGEISPDALSYVKPGDEYDETEVEEWWWNPEIGVPVMKKLEEAWDKKIEMEGKLRPVYKIKGTLRTFSLIFLLLLFFNLSLF